MRVTLLVLGLLNVALAKPPVDYWYRFCSKDTLKNAAITAACPQKDSNKQAECLFDSLDYQRSLIECFVASNVNRSLGINSYEDSFSYWVRKSKGDGEPSHTIQELLDMRKSDPVTQSYKEANSTKSGAFLARPQWVTENNVDAALEWSWQHRWADTLGQTTLAYVVGVMGIQIIFNFLSWFVPVGARLVANNPVSRYLRRWLVLPALIRKHRSESYRMLRYVKINVPPRFHAFLIFGYVAVCVICLAVHFPVYLGPVTSTKRSDYIGGYVGWRAGAILMYQMPLLFLFAGRNNFLIWLTGWQYEIFNHWHRWIGRLFLLTGFVHAFAYNVADYSDGTIRNRVNSEWWRWGIVALICMGILCTQGSKTFRAPRYEVFLVIHIIFAVVCVIGVWYHAKVHEGLEQCYTVWAIWAFDRAVRLGRIVAGGLNNKAHVRAHPNGYLELTVDFHGLWKPVSGSYCFVHYADPIRFWQSHPLSVVPTDESKTIKFYNRVMNGMTKRVYDEAVAKGGEMTKRIWLDGPYGVPLPAGKFDEVVLFAGGVGMTSVYGHLNHFLNEAGNETFYINWCISHPSIIDIFHVEVQKMMADSRVNLTIYLPDSKAPRSGASSGSNSSTDEKDESKYSEKPDSLGGLPIEKVPFCADFNELVTNSVVNCGGSLMFFTCGPPPMTDAIRKAVSRNILKTPNYVQYYEEAFSM